MPFCVVRFATGVQERIEKVPGSSCTPFDWPQHNCCAPGMESSCQPWSTRNLPGSFPVHCSALLLAVSEHECFAFVRTWPDRPRLEMIRGETCFFIKRNSPRKSRTRALRRTRDGVTMVVGFEEQICSTTGGGHYRRLSWVPRELLPTSWSK